MKKVILMMTLAGLAGFSSYAQTNRNYNTDLQTQRIYEEERRGGQISTGPVRLNTGTDNQETNSVDNLRVNSIQVLEGHRQTPGNIQRCYGVSDELKNGAAFTMENIQYYQGMSPRYYKGVEVESSIRWWDTSKTNGHCIGCGSDASWRSKHTFNPATGELIFKR